ncbi:MAG: DUF1992 domain-containing protein [Planctomycetaceae bacterium]|nr:DUF1992 domain-containing protein [Planctomycetaceae bacterium]
MAVRKPVGEKWDSFVERQIREAEARGEFGNLPGLGKPCAAMDEPFTQNDWLKKKLQRERLSALPPSLQIKYDIEQTLARLAEVTCEAEVVRQLELLNERIRRANLSSTWGPASTAMELDIPQHISRWRKRSF